jgi:hypothetical protein
MSSELIGGYLTLDLNQPIKWADFPPDALLADMMPTKLYTTGPFCIFYFLNAVVYDISVTGKVRLTVKPRITRVNCILPTRHG